MSQPRQKPIDEQTVLSPALIGFYGGCAAVSIGAAIAASGWIVFDRMTMVTIGLVMVIGGSFACLRCLRLARKE